MAAIDTGIGLPSGTIVTSDGSFSYTVTDHDLVTMARSIRVESPTDAPLIAWCYAQRYVMMRKNGWDGSLGAMITAFSQPINPIWFPDGSKCRPGGPYYGKQPCANAASRPGHATYPWSRIALPIRQTVLDFASARLPNELPRGVNFRARDSATVSDSLEYIPIGSRNRFFTDAASRAWPEDYVRIRWDGHTIGQAQPPWWAYMLTVIGAGGGVTAIAAAIRKRRGR
jgi:hypothetical protein